MKRQFPSFAPILFSFLLTPFLIFSQNAGSIAGKVIDGKLAEALIGCSVRLDEGGGGAVTDLDGAFQIRNVAPGIHKITVNYTGYQTKTIEGIVVKEGEATIVDIALDEPSLESLTEVVVVAKAQRESMSALTILQKTSPTIADGISAETIRRTPDRTTGDVIRRVSGASIQDNKFAVIRGLNDRYNIALLNGALLSSTEPDRKAFSFDLFPSSMLDNLIVMKTASADLPGEFAGGAIILNTKDIPEENFLQVNLNGGYNNITTFKPYTTSPGGGNDWLGTDDGGRAFPDGFPSTMEYVDLPNGAEEKYRFSQLFPNDWALLEKSSAAPNLGFQLSGGFVSNPERKTQFGTTLALSYSNNNRLQNAQRNDFDADGSQLFAYNDQQFKNNVLWGALFNSAVKINNLHKIGLQATYSTNTDNITNIRMGQDSFEQRYVRQTSLEYTENHLLTSRLFGEHQLTEKGLRVQWGGGYNRNTRDVPSLRRMFYYKNFDADEGEPFRAYLPFGSATLNNGGRFYSNLAEDVYNANADLSFPFALFSEKQTVKIGGLLQHKDRAFDARVLGFARSKPGVPSSLFIQSQDSIFRTENIGPNGFVISEITNPSDNYTAASDLYAGYVLLDNKLTERLRLSWGLRYEHFRQQLQALDYNGDPADFDRRFDAWLPSFNMTYSLNEKHQLRLSGSKTVTRPEFREVAPFAFYDFYLNAGVVGSPTLTPGTIYNADLRYEIYPGSNQLFSVSLFYKKFDNPIEFTFSSLGAGTRTFSFQNIGGARNYGAELEIRKNFDFIGGGWENVLFFANAALIRSTLELGNVSAYDTTRALQGQSPYILNAGLGYNLPGLGLSATLVYNVIGDRVAQVGTEGYADIYERHRNLLDFQLSKRLWQRGEVKLTLSDILRPDFVFYQDNNASHQYEAEHDNIIQSVNNGTTMSLSFGWRF